LLRGTLQGRLGCREFCSQPALLNRQLGSGVFLTRRPVFQVALEGSLLLIPVVIGALKQG